MVAMTTRIPNVRPGAVSGLSGEPLDGSGIATQDALTPPTDAEGTPEAPEAPEDAASDAQVPDGSVDDVLAWVWEPEEDAEVRERAAAALAAEGERDEQRKTLVDPLHAILAVPEDTPEE